MKQVTLILIGRGDRRNVSLNRAFIPKPEETLDIWFPLCLDTKYKSVPSAGFPGHHPSWSSYHFKITTFFLTVNVLIGNIHRHRLDD